MKSKIILTNTLRFFADFVIVLAEICAWTTLLCIGFLICLLLFL
jgi:hypothetical protein